MSTPELGPVIPALVTPLAEDRTVSAEGVARLVEHVLAGGASALLPLGSTGETALLDEAARREMLARTVDAAGGRAPVICGVAQPTPAGAAAELRAAAAAGAVAALVAPPFYYPTDQPAVLAFYRGLALASDLPILVYNIPQFTKVTIEPATVAALAREGAVHGIKDSSRDFEYFSRVAAATRDVAGFRLYTGSDTMLLASLAVGATGTICGGANLAPAWIRKVHDLFREGRLEAAREWQDRVLELVLATRAGVFPNAIKVALEAMGVCAAWAAAPTQPLDPESAERLRVRLRDWNLVPAVASRP